MAHGTTFPRTNPLRRAVPRRRGRENDKIRARREEDDRDRRWRKEKLSSIYLDQFHRRESPLADVRSSIKARGIYNRRCRIDVLSTSYTGLYLRLFSRRQRSTYYNAEACWLYVEAAVVLDPEVLWASKIKKPRAKREWS